MKKMKISPGLFVKGTLLGLRDNKLGREIHAVHIQDVRNVIAKAREIQGPRGDFEGLDEDTLIAGLISKDEQSVNTFECAVYLCAGAQGGWL